MFRPVYKGCVVNKYALLIRLNPESWPTWDKDIRPGQDHDEWFSTGRRIREEIHTGLPVVVLGTHPLGILAFGETASGAEFRPDPDWAKLPASVQADAKKPDNRVRIRMQGLAVPVTRDAIKADPAAAMLLKRRETITWLTSDEHASLMALIRAKNGEPR